MSEKKATGKRVRDAKGTYCEKPAKNTTGKASKGLHGRGKRAAMRERAKELKAAPRANKADGESDVLAKIAEMPEPDRTMAERLHALIKAELLPVLSASREPGTGSPRTPRTEMWSASGSKARRSSKTRYATSSASADKANLDEEGDVWPTAFALKELTAAVEARIGALVKKAVSWRWGAEPRRSATRTRPPDVFPVARRLLLSHTGVAAGPASSFVRHKRAPGCESGNRLLCGLHQRVLRRWLWPARLRRVERARRSTQAAAWPTTAATITSLEVREDSDADGTTYEVKVRVHLYSAARNETSW